MTKSGETSKKTVKKGNRSDRLAVALRENLRRRKAQTRGRGAASGPNADNQPKSS